MWRGKWEKKKKKKKDVAWERKEKKKLSGNV
jgi:hypothetical protein